MRAVLALALGLVTAGSPHSGLAQTVISIGGATTEIIYALGAGDRLIARDSTSTYPPEAQSLPDVGYARALSPEGVLSLGADMVIATENAGPPETLDVLDAAATTLVLVPETYTAEGIVEKIEIIGNALDLEAEARELTRTVQAQIQSATDAAEARSTTHRPKVLFILSAAGGRIMAAGSDTGADGILALAGAENAIQGLSGYKPITEEAIAIAAPDVILMMDRDGDHAVSDNALFAMPAIAATPAGQNRNVIRMDGLRLLGFGPRTAEAIEDLSRDLHGASW